MAENLSDVTLGDLEVHVHDYHRIEEVSLEGILAARMAAAAATAAAAGEAK